MLLTIFLAIVFSAAISLMLISAVAFIQNKKFFSSAPKEAQELIISCLVCVRSGEYFARIILGPHCHSKFRSLFLKPDAVKIMIP